MTIMPVPSPFITDHEHRFVLDEQAFMEAIEVPAFVPAPIVLDIEPVIRNLLQRNQVSYGRK
jgi:hypothetical protein